MPQHPTILVIDPDTAASRELSDLLLNLPGPPRICISMDVRPASLLLASERVDWLFIRLGEWDAYQLMAARAAQKARHVVFLSGRSEKCTRHLRFVLDGHLQPPYRASQVARICNRLSAPDFTARPLDFFFLKTKGRYIPIRYRDLQEVRRSWSKLHIKTRTADYETTGSLAAFQGRLPIPLTPVRRGLLVNEAFDPVEPAYLAGLVAPLFTDRSK
jgi:hypothetical protein